MTAYRVGLTIGIAGISIEWGQGSLSTQRGLAVAEHATGRVDDCGRIYAVFAAQGLLRAMFNKGVIDSQAVDNDIVNAAVAQHFENGAAETALNGIFFYRNDATDSFGQGENQFLVDRLDKPGIDHGCLDAMIG
jgi:hypothetical protein